MKKVLYLTVGCVLALSSCTKYDFDMDRSTVSKEHAENILGMIDPNQDWSSVNNGTITVTADANLDDIVKVQILTESPFMNTNTRVLAEVDVQKGQTVTLTYDAPNIYDRLIAACVDSKGHYYIKGFDLNEGQVSFQSIVARTRGVAKASDYPTNLTLNFSNSVKSYNAMRTIAANDAAASGDADFQKWVNDSHINLWAGKKWENERLWMVSGSGNSTWKVVDNTIMRTIDGISVDEKKYLNDIFGDFLNRNDPNNSKKKNDNMNLIRNSEAVKFYSNSLTSNGKGAITIIPIQMASTEIGYCHLYYYYYDPANIPSGMLEEDYVKSLPKFKAVQCSTTQKAANAGLDFFKVHEYLLPYFGEPEALMAEKVNSTTFCSTDGKLYRIRNGKQLDGKDYYMVYNSGTDDNDNSDKLATKYADDAANVRNQLWQVFTTKDGNKMLYNVGAKKFLVWQGDYATVYSDILSKVQSSYYKFDDANHILRYNNNKLGLGTDLGLKNSKRVSTNKDTSINDNFKWYFEEYEGKNLTAITDFVFEQFPASVTSPDVIIPEGYRIGFMLRKLRGSQDYKDNNIIKANNNGCCYSFGKLNQEINNLPGHFGSSKTLYTMEDDDPRAAIFSANKNTYIAFEDGSDCNFNDLIFEVGGEGFDNEYLYDLKEVEGQPYMMCFEDRSVTADYDMNDLVLRCKRNGENKDIVELSLVATGGIDDLWIQDIKGDYVSGEKLDSKEVHEFFGVGSAEGDGRFVNTVKGGKKHKVVVGNYKIGDMSIPRFLSEITIKNQTTFETIRAPHKGEAPVAIILPADFNYPMEKESITTVYSTFLNWAQNASLHTDWYDLTTDDAYPLEEILKITE